MKKIIDFLRKIGVLHVSKGDYNAGEFDNKKDIESPEPNVHSEMTERAEKNNEEKRF